MILLMTSSSVYADDLFQTGWGSAFNSSPEGQLVFILLQVVGIWTCIKSMMLLHAYNKGTQTTYSKWNCSMRFLAGVLLYYGHETANLIYNSF
jgi:hypothetical protein